jgi:hypothetical protein
MKRLALAALLFFLPCAAMAQTPQQVAQWVVEQHRGVEPPKMIKITYYEEEAWRKFLEDNNAPPVSEAVTNLGDFAAGNLIIRGGPLAHTDYHTIHEALHWAESALFGHKPPQVTHSENTIIMKVVTLMCGGNDYREWKAQFTTGQDLFPPGMMCAPDGGIWITR